MNLYDLVQSKDHRLFAPPLLLPDPVDAAFPPASGGSWALST